MAQKRRRGFKAPANYEPGRKPKGGRGRGPHAQGRAADGDAPDERRGSERRGSDRRETERRGRPDVHARPDRVARPERAKRPDRPAGERSGGGERARVFAFDEQGAPKGRERQGASASRLPAKRTTAADAAAASFAGLGLGGNIVRTLAEQGADRPFPIQVATIPDALAGRDVLGRARTGSGKTIAFGAALVERLLRLKAEGRFGEEQRPARQGKPKRGERVERAPRRQARNPKALILAPTRELALQIDRTVQPIARSVGFFTAQFVGGVPIEPQVHALSRGVDIVIGTPGRVQDLVNRRKLDLREVLVTVIDEADHMCELGFLEPVQRVLRQTERGGQRLLFSATLDGQVSELVEEFLRKPAVHEAEDGATGDVSHRVYVVLREDKDRALVELVSRPGRIMVFCRTRAYAERLSEAFVDAGLSATALHGDLSQARRERNLERFASGKAAILVATDVAARGIHVDDVDLVLQADPPDEPKAYVHRAGRTGRAGSDGEVVTVIARTRQKRTREMLQEAGIEPEFFGDYVPEGAVGVQRAGWIPGETPREDRGRGRG
ncbi:DEAD/DEAH box helicase [Leucobacter luti]|uniref:DEAD/DEAH box helicase n=1 Tax=Leucobacter luti TaxID=340320 RepID=UPI003D0783AC